MYIDRDWRIRHWRQRGFREGHTDRTVPHGSTVHLYPSSTTIRGELNIAGSLADNQTETSEQIQRRLVKELYEIVEEWTNEDMK